MSDAGMAPRTIELTCGTRIGERLRLRTFAHRILENTAKMNDRADRLAVDLLSTGWLVQLSANALLVWTKDQG